MLKFCPNKTLICPSLILKQNTMNIEKFEGVNMMGFQQLEIIKTADVASISKPVDNQVTVTLKPGRSWQKVYFTPESGLLSVSGKEDDAGEYFSVIATVQVPKVQTSVLQLLNDIRYRRMLLKVTNNNDEQWLIGTLNQPCKLTYHTNQSWNKTNAIEASFSIAESDTHPYLIAETISGGAFSNGFSNGYAI